MVRTFVDRLRSAGVNPDEVIPDDSRLYPAVLAHVWPMAVHHLCWLDPSVINFVWLARSLRNGSSSGKTIWGTDRLLVKRSGGTRYGGLMLRQRRSRRYVGNNSIWTWTISIG